MEIGDIPEIRGIIEERFRIVENLTNDLRREAGFLDSMLYAKNFTLEDVLSAVDWEVKGDYYDHKIILTGTTEHSELGDFGSFIASFDWGLLEFNHETEELILTINLVGEFYPKYPNLKINPEVLRKVQNHLNKLYILLYGKIGG